MSTKSGISVIICCYNSSQRIKETLKHIIQQQRPLELSIQLIIVDNASIDNTFEIVKSQQSALETAGINLDIVDEPKAGLSYARKKGLSCASNDYIIFCDDDNWLEEKYVSKVYNFFLNNPGVVIVGGCGEAVFEDISTVPVWFQQFQGGYAVGKQAEYSNNKMSSVYGAGLAVQKKLIDNEKFANSPLFLNDRTAKKLTSGGDSELCLKARLLGYQVGYLEDLKFKHYIPSKRLSWEYFKDLHRGFAESFIPITLYHKALNKEKVTAFYWFKQLYYFFGIYLKYWPKQFLKYRNIEGTNEEILHITWGVIALSYLQCNFKLLQMYRRILAIRV